MLRTLSSPPIASTLRRQIDKPKPEARPVRAALRERRKHLLGVARRKAAALVSDFDQHAIPGGTDSTSGYVR